MWQVSGRSNITDFEEVVELDREYISHWNMGLDFEYLLRFLSIIDMPTEIQSDCETYDQTIDIDCGTIA